MAMIACGATTAPCGVIVCLLSGVTGLAAAPASGVGARHVAPYLRRAAAGEIEK
jgi:hypothetical protein